MSLSWVTVVWSAIASACLAFALVHLGIWLKQPGERAHLVFSALAVSVAAIAVCELLLMRAQMPAEFGAILRWRQVPVFILVISVVAYLRLYFRAGNLWLGGGACGLRLLTLVLNFIYEPNFYYREITGLRQLELPGGELVSVPVGTAGPWLWIGQLSSLLLLLFVVDASVALWRRGGSVERRRAAVVGGSFALFVAIAAGTGLLLHAGVIHVPYMLSIPFLAIVAATGYELSTDVVGAAQLARQLQASEARFRAMANTAPVLIWMSGTDKLCTFFNQGWLDFTGRTLQQELGSGWTEGVHREDFDRCLEIYARAFDARQEFTMEYRLRRFDGEYRCVLDHGVPRSEPDSAFAGYIGTAVDVTELKRSEENFRLAVEASPSAMAMANEQGGIVMVNEQTERTFGYAREELIGQPIEMLVPEWYRIDHPAHRPGFFAAPQARSMGAGRELFGRRKDGSKVPVEVVLNPVHAQAGLFVLASIIDITERKRVEKELAERRSELAHLSRVTMLGELSGSLAHELNQPLTAILSNAQAAQRFLARDDVDLDEVRAILKDIVSDDKRAGEVIRGLRLLLRKGEARRQPLDLNEVVRDVIRLVHSDLLNHAVNLHTELAPALPAVNADRVQLQQVLLNLVVNGYEAMADVTSVERRLVVRTSPAEEEGVCVSVADMGHGIPPENLERVFEPFFTTKTQGLGLGLAVCRTIISAQGGQLWATNNTTRGASFHFKLPVNSARPA